MTFPIPTIDATHTYTVSGDCTLWFAGPFQVLVDYVGCPSPGICPHAIPLEYPYYRWPRVLGTQLGMRVLWCLDCVEEALARPDVIVEGEV